MNEFISLCNYNDYNRVTLLRIGETIDRIYDKYCSKPLADVVEVRHGEWLPVTTYDGREHLYRCSVCNRHEQVIYEYCHCGAKMDGKGEDNATD